MILQQIPGEVIINDVTQYLRDSYWTSYNIPFSPYIYNKSGYVDFIKIIIIIVQELKYLEETEAIYILTKILNFS